MANTTNRDGAAAGAGRISSRQGCWIKYQLNLGGIVYRTVAQEAGLVANTVSDFIVGRKNFERVKAALCKFLGYKTFEDLLRAADAADGNRGAA